MERPAPRTDPSGPTATAAQAQAQVAAEGRFKFPPLIGFAGALAP